jgi:hypothetical protein
VCLCVCACGRSVMSESSDSVVQVLGKCLLSLPIHRSTDDDFCRCASGVWTPSVVGVGEGCGWAGGEGGRRGLLCEGSLGMCAGLRLEC